MSTGILWRYARTASMDVSVGEDTNIFSYTDVNSVSEYAIPALRWTCGAGIMQGDNGNLTLISETTRIQIVAMNMTAE